MVGVGEFCSEAGFVKFGLLVVTLTVAVMLLNASVLPIMLQKLISLLLSLSVNVVISYINPH